MSQAMWPMNNYQYWIDVTEVHDGDTFSCVVHLPFYIDIEMACRIAGINAIELGDPGGPEAMRHLYNLLYNADKTWVVSMKPDKFSGRFDATVFTSVETSPGYVTATDVGGQMVEDGYAVEWNGRGPKPTPPWPIPVTK